LTGAGFAFHCAGVEHWWDAQWWRTTAELEEVLVVDTYRNSTSAEI